MPTLTPTLAVPGQSAATSGAVPKHQLRQRSPQGKRGKPRRNSVPPPRRLKERVRDLRERRWFLPALALGVACFLGLLYSAIRISARSGDYSAVPTPRRTPYRRPAPKEPSPPSSAEVVPEPLLRAGKFADGNAKAHDVLDQAVRHALEDAWKLPPHVAKERRNEDTSRDGAGAPRDAGASDGASGRQRTLAELYADLEELGVSAHELQEALDEAMRESGER